MRSHAQKLSPSPEGRPRTQLTILNGGANRGAKLGLRAIAEWNEHSENVRLAPHYVEPVPGRGRALVKHEAAQLGVVATAEEGRIEEVARNPEYKNLVILLNLDRGGAIATTLRVAKENPILAYLLIKLPNDELWGVRCVFDRATPPELRENAAEMFDTIGRLTARRGAAAVLGGDSEQPIERQYRSWFGLHTQQQLTKLVAGIEPDADQVEITDDGDTTYATMIRRGTSWTNPTDLAEELAAKPPQAILAGQSFIIAEVVPQEGVRFHKVRRRLLDGRLALVGGAIIDTKSVDEAISREDAERRAQESALRLAREAAEALRKAERLTISRNSPVITTD